VPLTRFPDHEDKRVYLSTVLAFNLPAPDSAHSDRMSIAVFWIEAASPAARELNLDFAIDLMDHGALGVVCGGSGAAAAAEVFEQAVSEGEFVREEAETIGVWALPEATLEEVLWIAAEEAMVPDAYVERPWDIVVWARSGDPSVQQLRQILPRLSQVVDDFYDLGGEDE
jgi:hypothetical protein